ncbi:MAG: hypothetical protein ACYSWZ_15140, partial [Planctomycetota bacterium]
MNRKRIITWCVLGIALAAFVSSCSKSPKYKGKIGVTCMDLTNPFFKLIANVMQEDAAKYGYEIVALSGENDPAKQNNQ